MKRGLPSKSRLGYSPKVVMLTFIEAFLFGLLKLPEFLVGLLQSLLEFLAADLLLILLCSLQSCNCCVMGLCLFFGASDAPSVGLRVP